MEPPVKINDLKAGYSNIQILNGINLFVNKGQIITFQNSISMDTLGKLQNKLTLILESFLPKFLFDMFNDAMINLDSSVSKIWSSGLSYIQTSAMNS